jgi:hypothetical protein
MPMRRVSDVISITINNNDLNGDDIGDINKQ